jgi:bifunctional non-homologous end joining protein LigD
MSGEVAGRPLALSSLNKQLWPGFTKAELVDYYLGIAPVLLPHLAGRAITLGRFPDGIDGPAFAQTECRGRPDWIPTRPVRLRSGIIRNYCLIEEPAALAWVANLGTLELHPFLHRENPDRPDFVVFDLDPGAGAGLSECCWAALRLREMLGELGLAAAAKTSGGYGLHVYVPLGPAHSYADNKRFVRKVAARLATEEPARITDRSAKELRAGRVLVDWAQNDRSRSTVAPYSPRAADRPAVSTPLTWEEVERGDPDGLRFPPERVLARARRLGDPFARVLTSRQRLPVD